MTANTTTAEIATCQWTTINGRVFCATHQQLGQRVGLGKLYRVTNATGLRLVRAPDPATAQAAVQGVRVERAQPHEADGRADLVDARPLEHIARKGTRAAPRASRPWAAATPVQFDEASGAPRRCAAWELDDAAPTIDPVTGRSAPAGDDPTEGQRDGGAGPPMRRAGRTVKVGKDTLCIGPDGKVIAGQQHEGDEPAAPEHAPCRWDELGPRHLVCLVHNRIIAAPAQLSAWEHGLARVKGIFTTNFGRPRAR